MRRTYLIVPADDTDRLVKAPGVGADAVVVDLAGTVAEPGSARSIAAAFVAAAEPSAEIWVRINPGPVGHDDARELAAAGPALRGVFVARTDSPIQLDALDTVLSTVESEAGRPGRSVAVVASLESAGSVLAAAAIARAPRVAQLFLREDDIVAELGLRPSADEHELLWLRSQVVLASAAAAVAPPIGSARPSHDAWAALRQSTMELRRLGFGGRACVDPDQVAVVDEILRPTPEEVAEARDVLDRWAGANQHTGVVCHDVAGRIIDEARVRRAQRIINGG